jgi:hypothetical protein
MTPQGAIRFGTGHNFDGVSAQIIQGIRAGFTVISPALRCGTMLVYYFRRGLSLYQQNVAAGRLRKGEGDKNEKQ